MAYSNDTVAENTKSSFTPNGKEIKIFQKKGTALYCIRFADGGELPAELNNQMFTTPKEAQKAIDAYIARKEKEKAKSAKKVNKE